MYNIRRKVPFRIAVAITIMALILLIGGAGAAPMEKWNRTFGESGSDSIVYVKQTSDGGYDIIGETFIQGGPRIGECKGGFCWDMWLSTRKIWFSKINAKGDVKLSKILRTGYSNGGDTRYFQQTSDGGHIIATNSLTYGSNYSFNSPLIIKIDSDGNEQWSNTFGREVDNAYSVQQSSDGGYIFAGQSGGYAWLVKTNSYGNEMWNKTFKGKNWSSAYSVRQTLDGGYIIGGWTKKNESNDYYGWLIKVDSNGNKQWDKTFERLDEYYALDAQQTMDAGYILTYRKIYETVMPYNRFAWLIKTDSNGIEQWNKTFSVKNASYYVDSVQQTSAGGYLLTGRTNDEAAWLFKTDFNGIEQWNKTFRVINTSYYIDSVQQTSDGGYIITGRIDASGGYDAWLVKTSGETSEIAEVSAAIPIVAIAISPTITPTPTLTVVETSTLSSREKASGFDIALAMTILLLAIIIRRRRMNT